MQVSLTTTVHMLVTAINEIIQVHGTYCVIQIKEIILFNTGIQYIPSGNKFVGSLAIYKQENNDYLSKRVVPFDIVYVAHWNNIEKYRQPLVHHNTKCEHSKCCGTISIL